MGSPLELEIHAYFHNYHSKLKFVGSQLLRTRPDLPTCSQVVHSNHLHPEGSEGFICQWENCDVGIFFFRLFTKRLLATWHWNRMLSFYRVHLTIQSGSTDMWTITWKVLSHSLWPNSSRLYSASGQVPPCKVTFTTPITWFVVFIKHLLYPCCRVWCFLQDQVPFERTHAKPHPGEARGLSYLRQHVLQQHKAVWPLAQAGRASR